MPGFRPPGLAPAGRRSAGGLSPEESSAALQTALAARLASFVEQELAHLADDDRLWDGIGQEGVVSRLVQLDDAASLHLATEAVDLAAQKRFPIFAPAGDQLGLCGGVGAGRNVRGVLDNVECQAGDDRQDRRHGARPGSRARCPQRSRAESSGTVWSGRPR